MEYRRSLRLIVQVQENVRTSLLPNGLQYRLEKEYAMQTITEETKKKVVKLHIQDGRTIASLAAEYGICHATVSNWIRAYREECQTID